MEKMIAACGADCSACDSLPQCGGCSKAEGKVFYRGGAVCPIYDCASKKNRQDCSECSIKDCSTYMGQKDPRMTDEQFENWVDVKIANLKKKSV